MTLELRNGGKDDEFCVAIFSKYFCSRRKKILILFDDETDPVTLYFEIMIFIVHGKRP